MGQVVGVDQADCLLFASALHSVPQLLAQEVSFFFVCCHSPWYLILPVLTHFPMRLIGHRGVPVLATENTLPSFCEAARLGVMEVEFDVRLASCQTPVVIHDENLRRTHGKDLWVAATPAATLASFGVPRLADVMSELDRLGLRATVEIKACSPDVFPHVLSFCIPGGHTLSSFDTRWMKQAVGLPLVVPLQWTVGALDAIRPIRVPAPVLEGRVGEVAADIDRITPAGVARARDLGLKVLSYTIRRRAQLQKAVRLGLDGVFVDDPEAVRGWVAEIAPS